MKTGHNSSKPALPWKRFIAFALIFIMSAGFAACQPKQEAWDYVANIEITPVPLSHAQESITRSNITYTDVLAIYDTLVQDIWDVYHLHKNPSFTDNGANLFLSISPVAFPDSTDGTNTEGLIKDGAIYRYPFYFSSRSNISYDSTKLYARKYAESLPELRGQRWFVDINMRHFYHDNNTGFDFSMPKIAVNATQMKSLMRSFGLNIRKATQKDKQVSHGICDVGDSICDAIIITRETIINADQEQLWLLYTVAASIYSLNFFKEQTNLSRDFHTDVTAYIEKTRASAEGS